MYKVYTYIHFWCLIKIFEGCTVGSWGGLWPKYLLNPDCTLLSWGLK